MTTWLTVRESDIPLDVDILLRSDDKFGLGRSFECLNLKSEQHDKDSAYAACFPFVEFMVIPK